MKIVGKQEVNYISKKTNQPVSGITLHCTSTRKDVEGMSVETIFVSTRSNMYDDIVKIPVGSEVEVGYNRWGSAEYVVPVK